MRFTNSFAVSVLLFLALLLGSGCAPSIQHQKLAVAQQQAKAPVQHRQDNSGELKWYEVEVADTSYGELGLNVYYYDQNRNFYWEAGKLVSGQPNRFSVQLPESVRKIRFSFYKDSAEAVRGGGLDVCVEELHIFSNNSYYRKVSGAAMLPYGFAELSFIRNATQYHESSEPFWRNPTECSYELMHPVAYHLD